MERSDLPESLSIAQVAAPAETGGLERVVQTLSRGLHRRGHEINTIAILEPSNRDHPFLRPLRRAGVPSTPLHVPARGYLQERKKFRRLLRALEPDVVHTHGYRPDLLDATVARSLDIPTVTTVHGSSLLGGVVTSFYEWLQKKSFRFFDAVVAVSDPLQEDVESHGVSEESVHYIPNVWTEDRSLPHPADARRALGCEEDSFLIGWVGRLIEAKGCDVFLDALARLNNHRWKAVVVGDGPQAPALRQQAAKLDLHDRVEFRGTVADAARFFPGLDLFVLSSRTEGTPVVLVEAIMAETPIVATSVGGVPDILSPRLGRLVPPMDPDALATSIQDVMIDPESAHHRAERAYSMLRGEFSLESWLSAYEDVYLEVSTRTMD